MRFQGGKRAEQTYLKVEYELIEETKELIGLHIVFGKVRQSLFQLFLILFELFLSSIESSLGIRRETLVN